LQAAEKCSIYTPRSVISGSNKKLLFLIAPRAFW
jgi:hypothetical protein